MQLLNNMLYNQLLTNIKQKQKHELGLRMRNNTHAVTLL